MIALPTESTESERTGTTSEAVLDVTASASKGRPRLSPASARLDSTSGSYEEISAWLQNEAERHFTQGQYGASEQKVRQLLDLQSQVVGQEHADFALGLSMLGELRFLQGDRVEAERLFRGSLGIRSRVLGRSHPDFAVSLTCLAGMLWRRNALVEAERCLREALEIRYEALGPGHPDSIQARKELVRVLRRRGDWAAAHALIRHANEQLALTTGVKAREDLAEAVVVLSSDLSQLGERLAVAARKMNSIGAPPPPQAAADMEACRRLFVSIQNQTRDRIEALRVPSPPPIELETLHNLASVLDDLTDAELQNEECEQLRLRALNVLDRILALEYWRNEEYPPLRECQLRAAQLRDTIESEHWLELPAQTESLAEGTHAFVNLLILVEHRDELDDQDWADLHELVSDSLGKPLALAASRARLILRAIPERQREIPGRTELPRAARVESLRPPTPVLAEPRLALSEVPPPELQSPLLRELALASLIPTMGTVINLPTASATDQQAHRLLRAGRAPNVVERSEVAPLESASRDAASRTLQLRGDAPTSSAERRPARAIIAGPAPLLSSFGALTDSRSPVGPMPVSVFGARNTRSEPATPLHNAVPPSFISRTRN